MNIFDTYFVKIHGGTILVSLARQLEVDALRRWEISQFKKLADSDLDAQYDIVLSHTHL